jgi:AcrR family transcriptional regulator
MARDSTETKRRIFEAATKEFALHGIAGARIDRIAGEARANKQLIYAYFGKKHALFDAVATEHVLGFIDKVPFDATDLPGYGAATFDYYREHPEIGHLVAWHALEPGEKAHRLAVIENGIKERTREIERAQKAGLVNAEIPGAELLALVDSTARTWAVPTPERDPKSGVGPRVVARRRQAVVDAITRVTSPGGAD